MQMKIRATQHSVSRNKAVEKKYVTEKPRLYFIFCVHVYFMCMYMYLCVQVCLPTHAHVEARGLHIRFWSGVSGNLELFVLALQAGQEEQATPHHARATGVHPAHTLSFDMDPGDPNSGIHGYPTSILVNEPTFKF